MVSPEESFGDHFVGDGCPSGGLPYFDRLIRQLVGDSPPNQFIDFWRTRSATRFLVKSIQLLKLIEQEGFNIDPQASYQEGTDFILSDHPNRVVKIHTQEVYSASEGVQIKIKDQRLVFISDDTKYNSYPGIITKNPVSDQMVLIAFGISKNLPKYIEGRGLTHAITEPVKLGSTWYHLPNSLQLEASHLLAIDEFYRVVGIDVMTHLEDPKSNKPPTGGGTFGKRFKLRPGLKPSFGAFSI